MIRFFLFLLVPFLPSVLFAQSLTTSDLDARFDDISEQESVSRYDLAEFLVLATCKQCALPDALQKETYTQQWRDEKKKDTGVFVKDITPGEEIYQWREYSYCLAEVVDAWRMNWYPTSTSPLCPWRFCGANTLVFGEFTQALMNILDPADYARYTIDRKKVTSRMASQPENFTLEDASVVKNARNRCDEESECSVKQEEELRIYTRYCRYHLEECNVQTTRALWAGEYPLVEVNVLVDQWIFSREEVLEVGRYDLVSGAFFSETLQRIVSEKWCEWKVDFDNDDLGNSVDLCPNRYNPQQFDQDKDGIGDVCDDDIDGDSILNEIWVVDDRWYINFPLLEISQDNCLRIPNTNQRDENENGIWDACEETSESHSFSISAEPSVWTAPLATSFTPFYSWSVVAIDRTFWDKSYGNERGEIEHIYDSPGIYIAKWVATFEDGQIGVWKVTVNVLQPRTWEWELPDIPELSTNLIVFPVEWSIGETIDAEIEIIWGKSNEVSQVVRDWDDGTSRPKTWVGALLDSHVYASPGTYRVWATVYIGKEYFILEETVSISQGDACETNLWSCDFDGDEIIDRCDDDIDGDGIENLLWLLVWESESCEFSEDIINPDREKDQRDRIQNWEDLDNCFFLPNPDQQDEDSDGDWDVCDGNNGWETGGESWADNDWDTWWGEWGDEWDTGGDSWADNDWDSGWDGWWGGDWWSTDWDWRWGWDGDRDGDWLPDDRDACPDVPESNNGYQSKDGCPEPPRVSMPDRPRKPYISAWTCNQCPCPSSNYDAELMPWDRVKAVLVDKAGEIIYSHSSPVLITEF